MARYNAWERKHRSADEIARERKARKEYRAWAHGEMELWLNNDERMYNRMHKIVSNPRLSRSGKVDIMKNNFADFHNGQVKVGSYANFTKIVTELEAEYAAGQYGTFADYAEYKAWYATHESPYPASRPCHVTIEAVPTLALPDGKPHCGRCDGDYAIGDTHCMHCGYEL